jgi:hypothetical protein
MTVPSALNNPLQKDTLHLQGAQQETPENTAHESPPQESSHESPQHVPKPLTSSQTIPPEPQPIQQSLERELLQVEGHAQESNLDSQEDSQVDANSPENKEAQEDETEDTDDEDEMI